VVDVIPPELQPVVDRLERIEAVAAVDWAAYRKCSGCGAEIGTPCRSLSGAVVGGRPDGVATALPHAHAARQLRVRRRPRPR
jgi:hypothetical protein